MKNTVIVTGAIILMLPLIYLGMRFYDGMDKDTGLFRGAAVHVINEPDGYVQVPTQQEDAAGAPMRAGFSSAFLEKITGVAPPMRERLELTIDSTDNAINGCLEDGSVPLKAVYEVQAACETALFKTPKAPEGRALFLDAPLQLISHLGGEKLSHRVVHKGVVASFETAAMTQSDLKREACFAKAALNYIFNIKQDPPLDCFVAKG